MPTTAHPMPLRPHQKDALKALTDAFVAVEERVTVVSACGTGKTHTAIAAAHHLAADGAVLVAVPTLELVKQTRLAVRREHMDAGEAEGLRERPDAPAAAGRLRRLEPVKGRPRPGRVGQPPSKIYWCTYARAWVSVESTYELSVTENEKATLTDMLGTCPS